MSPFQKHVEEFEDKVVLNCTGITWLEGTMGIKLQDNQSLNLGRRVLDPRGVYLCNETKNGRTPYTLQVYYRSACLWVGMDGASGCENFLAGWRGAVVNQSVF